MGIIKDLGKLIYETKEYKGYGKQNYYSNDYYLNGDEITKVKHNRFKSFDGDENEWHESDKVVSRWNKDDDDVPGWLRDLLDK